MKVICMGEPQTIMDNPLGKHKYFGWPTVARLQNGKIAVVASGYRRRHVCPFGKMVIAYSEDEGKTYTRPAPVIDTVLDDRDGGILPFGENSVMVTSFNNVTAFQRQCVEDAYDTGYLDSVTPEEEQAALGATFRLSHDGGVTFGPLYKSPITSPHGPIQLPDGSILWVGRTFSPLDAQKKENECVQAYRVNLDGTMDYVGQIDNIDLNGKAPLSCEPHAIALPDGRILVHIRVQMGDFIREEDGVFTVFQSESSDGGRTWSKPRQILPLKGGSPAHLLRHSSGVLLSTYGYRLSPEGVKVMFSHDDGQTWDTGYDLYVNGKTPDLGYPSTIELGDGSLLTVFYACPDEGQPAVIMQQRWRFEE